MNQDMIRRYRQIRCGPPATGCAALELQDDLQYFIGYPPVYFGLPARIAFAAEDESGVYVELEVYGTKVANQE